MTKTTSEKERHKWMGANAAAAAAAAGGGGGVCKRHIGLAPHVISYQFKPHRKQVRRRKIG
ncbi:unnamed protein product [Echinostoma caproni]|uniref:Uncharacterized protein n=1 Tax=Echinostoma caproni TaxID=27848 RepID=A0A183BBB7_9TREM|nr:unnamed protein product [Echinostoma caproni]